MRTTKQYRCLEPKIKRLHFTCYVVFYESTLYYKEELRRTTPSLVSGDEKISEFELEQEHEPIAAAPKKTSATVARATQRPN